MLKFRLISETKQPQATSRNSKIKEEEGKEKIKSSWARSRCHAWFMHGTVGSGVAWFLLHVANMMKLIGRRLYFVALILRVYIFFFSFVFIWPTNVGQFLLCWYESRVIFIFFPRWKSNQPTSDILQSTFILHEAAWQFFNIIIYIFFFQQVYQSL
jgi:hypothetical protein